MRTLRCLRRIEQMTTPPLHIRSAPPLAQGRQFALVVGELLAAPEDNVGACFRASGMSLNPSTIVPMVPLPQGELTEGQERVAWAIRQGRQPSPTPPHAQSP